MNKSSICGERCLKMLPGVFFQTSRPTVLDDDKNVNTQN